MKWGRGYLCRWVYVVSLNRCYFFCLVWSSLVDRGDMERWLLIEILSDIIRSSVATGTPCCRRVIAAVSVSWTAIILCRGYLVLWLSLSCCCRRWLVDDYKMEHNVFHQSCYFGACISSHLVLLWPLRHCSYKTIVCILIEDSVCLQY